MQWPPIDESPENEFLSTQGWTTNSEGALIFKEISVEIVSLFECFRDTMSYQNVICTILKDEDHDKYSVNFLCSNTIKALNYPKIPT